MILEPPEDGWTNDEQHFFRLTILIIYQKVNDPIDKFILIAKNEAGYTQDEIGKMLGISQEAVSKRYNNTLTRLRDYKAQGIL